MSSFRLPPAQSYVNQMLKGDYITNNLVSSSYLHSQANEEEARQGNYLKYREYYDGDHDTLLTARLKEFLNVKGEDDEFNFNLCPIVVDALAERLKVTGFKTGDTVEDPQGETLWDYWDGNDMDGQQGIVHTAAVRDGDTYVMVGWDNEKTQPKITHELACTGGEGVKVQYDPEDKSKIASASKRWVISGKRRRLNLYFEDHIEKYISNEGDFEGNYRPYLDPPIPGQASGEELPGELGPCGWYWWTDTGTQSGKPLGVPVVHFKNKDQGYCVGQSDLKDVIPLQNALNKTVIDMLASTDVSAFRLLWATGVNKDDVFKVFPGAVLKASDPNTRIGSIEGENPVSLIAVKDAFVTAIAQVTRTPISYFQTSGQRPAEGTLKQEESGLVAKALKCQTDFGNSWEKVMQMARRLANVYGGAGLDEDASIDCQWKEPQTRDELQHLQTLEAKQRLGIPQEQIWAEMGYNAKEIARFHKIKLRNQAMFTRNSGGDTDGNQPGPGQGGQPGQPEPDEDEERPGKPEERAA